MNISKDCPYTEEEMREGMNTVKNNFMNFYKDYSKEELIEHIFVMFSQVISLNQERKELKEKLKDK